MSKQRKLQLEIESTLKRIMEGVADWDMLYDKLDETEDASQRDKIMSEMKRELKKLQRLREQVRGWAASGEVKDDSRLTEARKAVEREMERFKVLERELKIKQFSSEGLLRDTGTDPLLLAKMQCADWINEAVTQLETQVEQFEADLEALGPVKGKNKPPRVVELEGFIRKHQEHVTKLEQVLRLLENDQVTAEEVEGAIRDGIDYYLASSTETDFVADDSMYDALPLKEVDDSIGKITAHTPRAPGKAKDNGEGQAGEGAPEQGKGKRGKAAKAGGKAKGSDATPSAAGAKAAKPAVAPPPGLPPPPSSPASSPAASPYAASRPASFKAVAAGVKPPPPPPAVPAAGSPGKQGAGAPETPAPGQAGAAATPPTGPPRPQRPAQNGGPAPEEAAAAAAAAKMAGFGIPSPEQAAAAPSSTPSAASSPAAASGQPAAAGVPSGAQQAGLAAAPAAPLPAAQAAAQPFQEPPLSPASAARLGAFNEQMLLAAAAHQAEQQARLQAQQMGLGVAGQQGAAPAGEAPAPSLPVLGVPPGLAPVALHSAHSLTGSMPPSAAGGHSPLAALAGAAAAAAAAAASAAGMAGSPPPSAREQSMDSLAGLVQVGQGLGPQAAMQQHQLQQYQQQYQVAVPRAGSSLLPESGAASPASRKSAGLAGGEEGEGRRWQAGDAVSAAEVAAAAAAAATAGTAASPHAREAAGAGRMGIPTVLSFNHLQSQAELVLGLGGEGGGAGAGAGGGAPEEAGPSLPTGAPTAAPAASLDANGTGEPQGAVGAGPPQLPWVPTLLDLQLLETSVNNRPQPGDGDWVLSQGSLSAAGTPAPAQRPVVTPASYPNQVHASLRREETFKKLSAETHFFAFYFQQNTRQQLFAANALKAQGWRFHTQFNAWFARQSQPRVVTETHEQGPLVYFDSLLHNVTPPTSGLLPPAQPRFDGWCPRVSRPDFLFEYKFMEQEDTQAPSDPS